MERDLELIRKIFLCLEEMPGRGEDLDLSFEGYDEKVVVYNMDLAIQAGLVEGNVRWAADTSDIFWWSIQSLTWDGHDFLNSVREEHVWKATQDKVASAGLTAGQVTLDVIKTVATSVIKQSLGLPE